MQPTRQQRATQPEEAQQVDHDRQANVTRDELAARQDGVGQQTDRTEIGHGRQRAVGRGVVVRLVGRVAKLGGTRQRDRRQIVRRRSDDRVAHIDWSDRLQHRHGLRSPSLAPHGRHPRRRSAGGSGPWIEYSEETLARGAPESPIPPARGRGAGGLCYHYDD
jgi:hypothetical protein